MKKLILYRADETEFKTHGLGVINDAISCTVESTVVGGGELLLTYPADGEMVRFFQQRNIIYTKPSPTKKAQPYRIYHVSEPLRGRVKVYARHLCYDTGGVVVSPVQASNAAGAVEGIMENTVNANPFTVKTSMTNIGEFDTVRPQSLRECIFGEKNSLASVYGAEFEIDHRHIRMVERLGGDHGYRIKYGINLIDARQEKSSENVYTGIYPYFFEETDGIRTIVTLPEKIIKAEGSFGFEKTLPVDLSSDLLNEPTEEELRDAANAYLKEHKIGVPQISIDVVFALLREYEEYRDIARLESVELGDDVSVDIAKMRITAKARVISTVYDAIADRYESISIGDAKNTLADSIFYIENGVLEAKRNAGNAGRGVARVEAKVTDTRAEVNALAEWRTDADRSIAAIGLQADEQGAQISAKVSKKAGGKSFGWDLTLDKWQVSSNGIPVFVITKNGAQVIGHIEAESGKIGDFSVTKNGLTYGTVYIGTDIVGFGKKPEDIEQYETVFSTSIDRDGYLVSSKTKLYNPNLFGNIFFGGSPAAGHAVKSAIPFILPSLMVGGSDISTHERRIAALEEAISGGGGGGGGGGGIVSSYSVYIVVEYYDNNGFLVSSDVDVNGVYPAGTSFEYPETKELDGITYINTNGGVNIVVTNSDVNATVVYEEESSEEEISIYSVSIDIEYNMLDGSTETVQDVRGLYRSGETFSYPKETTYSGKSFVSSTGEAVDIVVVASDISETISYIEQSTSAPEFDVYMSVGDAISYPYGSVTPEITIDGSGLTYYDDGGAIEFLAEATGQGKVTIKESDIVLEEWTYIIT